VNVGAWIFLGLASVAAVADWVAVQRHDKRIEYFAKPATMLLLMAVAAVVDVDNGAVRDWFLIALALSLVGDIFLMLPGELFIFGLGAFLLAHLAFIVGLWTGGLSILVFVAGLGVTGLAAAFIGGKIIDSVREGESPGLAVPIAGYMAVISVMVASAAGTEEVLALAGAALFYCSDALIAWDRFVRKRVWHPVAIMVTYHLAQAGLTLSLVT
jgi:uncharacterized membrane protein YhhN